MKPERWAQIKEILNDALQLPGAQRAAYVQQACAEPDLRREVESLLHSHQQAENFLETPATQVLVADEPDPDHSLIGHTVGTYRVLEEIGRGGMGVIFKAEDLKLGRNVALKFLPEETARDRETRDRFEREARAASALNHRNICTIYGVDEHQGRPFIAMELLKGRTLPELMGQRPLPAPLLFNLAIQITSALEAAHSEGIIHRDIKPANIFVTDSGQVKVLDFGIAKRASARIPSKDITADLHLQSTASQLLLTRAGLAMGTAAYMSPEQARGEQLDPRTDLFSVGAALYEMATGKQAFTDETTAAIQEAILHSTPPPPLQLNPELPPRMDEIISKALEKDREVRYQSAAELRADLKRVRRDTTSGKLKASSDSTILGSRRRWKFMSAVVLAAAAIVLAVLFYPRPKHLTERDSILLTEFVNTTGEPVFDGTLKQALAVKLEESPFLNVVPEERVQQTLRYMGRSPDDRVTAVVGKEICQREAIAAMLTGSIANMGSHYVVTLDATDCHSGAHLAREQVEAEKKEQVLRVVGAAASRLRRKLGESLSSIRSTTPPSKRRPRLLWMPSKPSAWETPSAPAAPIPHRSRSTSAPSNWIPISQWPTLL